MTYREIEKILISNGWYHHYANEAHYIFKNNEKKGSIVVPRQNGDISKGTINSILKQLNT